MYKRQEKVNPSARLNSTLPLKVIGFIIFPEVCLISVYQILKYKFLKTIDVVSSAFYMRI